MTTTLYHYPMACSTACRIVAAEAGTSIKVREVDLYTKKVEGGGCLYDLNPMGQVATLELPGGGVLTETATILLWLQHHGRKREYTRMPESPDYFRLLSWLNFCATELHKGLVWLLMRPDVPATAKEMALAGAEAKLLHVSDRLEGQHGLLASGPCAADAYLLWALTLMQFAGVGFADYPVLMRFQEAMMERPLVAGVVQEDIARVQQLRQQAKAAE